MSLGKLSNTNRGFPIIVFSDSSGNECSLQISSLADEEAVWLGVNDASPKVMASQAASVGVTTKETAGWVPYPIPSEVLLNTRMHLTRERARELIAALEHWLSTGTLADNEYDEDLRTMRAIEGALWGKNSAEITLFKKPNDPNERLNKPNYNPPSFEDFDK